MKIAVCVKEVLDTRLPLQVRVPSGEIVPSGRERTVLINPADRAALEVALRLREQSPKNLVAVFSVCAADQVGPLCFALARGADYAERVISEEQFPGPPYTACLLAERFMEEPFDLICCGDETLDNSSATVGPLVAELLDLPQITGVSRVQELADNLLRVERSLERGHREVVEVELPALVTFKIEAAEPQYVSARRLQNAARTELPVRRLDVEFRDSKLPRWPESERRVPPRARVKKRFAPDSNLSAADRVKMVMSGGMAPQPSTQSASILEGDPDYLSEQIFRFLKHHELI